MIVNQARAHDGKAQIIRASCIVEKWSVYFILVQEDLQSFNTTLDVIVPMRILDVDLPAKYLRAKLSEYSGLSNCDAATASASGDGVNYNQQYNVRNKENRKLYDQDYYIRNKDERRESMRDYYRRNGDRRKEYDHAYCVRKKDKIRDYYRAYNIRNTAEVKQSKRDYYLRNKDDILKAKRGYYLRTMESPETYSPRNAAFKSWKSPELVREFFDAIGRQLSISHHTDWYRVSRPQVVKLGGILCVILKWNLN
jgi:hypothetical protein